MQQQYILIVPLIPVAFVLGIAFQSYFTNKLLKDFRNELKKK